MTKFVRRCTLALGVSALFLSSCSISDLEADIAALDDKITALTETQLEDTASQAAALESAVATINAAIAAGDLANSTELSTEIAALQASIDAALAENAAASSAELATAVATLEAAIAAGDAANSAELATAVTALETAIATGDEANATALAAAVATLNAAIAENAAASTEALEAAVSALNATVDAALAENAAASTAELAAAVEVLNAAIAAGDAANTEALEAAVEALNAAIAAGDEAQAEALAEAVEVLEAAIAEEVAALEAAIAAGDLANSAEIATAVATLEAAIAAGDAANSAELATAQTALEAAIAAGDAANSAELATAVETINTSISTLAGVVATKADQADLDQLAEDLETEVADLYTYIDSEVLAAIADAKAYAKEYADALDAAQTTALLAAVTELTGMISAVEDSVTDLDTKLSALIATNTTNIEINAADIAALDTRLDAYDEIFGDDVKATISGWISEECSDLFMAYLDPTARNSEEASEEWEAFQTAVETLIDDALANDGAINSAIQDAIDEVNATYGYLIALVDDINTRLGTAEGDIENLQGETAALTIEIAKLLSQVQSISYVPSSFNSIIYNSEFVGSYYLRFRNYDPNSYDMAGAEELLAAYEEAVLVYEGAYEEYLLAVEAVTEADEDITAEALEELVEAAEAAEELAAEAYEEMNAALAALPTPQPVDGPYTMIPLTQASTLTVSYDVRPIAAAAAIAEAFEAGVGSYTMPFENYTRAITGMEVLDVVEGDADGRINVTFSYDMDEDMLTEDAAAFAFYVAIDEKFEYEDADDVYVAIDVMSDYVGLNDIDAIGGESYESVIFVTVDGDRIEELDIAFDATEPVSLFEDYTVTFTLAGVEYTLETLSELEAATGLDLSALAAITLVGEDDDDVAYFNYSDEEITEEASNLKTNTQDLEVELDTPSKSYTAGQYVVVDAAYEFTYDGTVYALHNVTSVVTIEPEVKSWSATTTTIWNYFDFLAPYSTGVVSVDTNGTYYIFYLDLENLEAEDSSDDILDIIEVKNHNGVSTKFTIEGYTIDETGEKVSVDTGITTVLANTKYFNEDSKKVNIYIPQATTYKTIWGDGTGTASNTINYVLSVDLTDIDGAGGEVLLCTYEIDVTSTFKAYPSAATTEDTIVFDYSSTQMSSTVATTYLGTFASFFADATDDESDGTEEFAALAADATATANTYAKRFTSYDGGEIYTEVYAGKNNGSELADDADEYLVTLHHDHYTYSDQLYNYLTSIEIDETCMPYSITLTGDIDASVDFDSVASEVVRNYEYFTKTTNTVSIIGQYLNSGVYYIDEDITVDNPAMGFGFRSIPMNSIFYVLNEDGDNAADTYTVEFAFEYTQDTTAPGEGDNSWIENDADNNFTFLSTATETTMAATEVKVDGVILSGAFEAIEADTFTIAVPDAQRPISYESDVLDMGGDITFEYAKVSTNGQTFTIADMISLEDRLEIDIFADDSSVWAVNELYKISSYATYATTDQIGTRIVPSVTFGEMSVTRIDVDGEELSVPYSDYASIVAYDSVTGEITVSNTGKYLNVDYVVTIPVEISTGLYYAVEDFTFTVLGNN